MKYRPAIRRAFPYAVVAVGGFAIAYIIIFTFVLPSRVIAPRQTPYVPDSSGVLRPIDTTLTPPPDTTAPPLQAMVPIGSGTPIPVEVPDITGMALSDARMVLNGMQLDATVRSDTSSLEPPGTVLRQDPASGAQLHAHDRVTLVVSRFPPPPDSLRDSLQRRTGDTTTRDTPPPPPRPTPPLNVPPRVRRPLPPIIPSTEPPPRPAATPATAPTPTRPDTGPGTAPAPDTSSPR